MTNPPSHDTALSSVALRSFANLFSALLIAILLNSCQTLQPNQTGAAAVNSIADASKVVADQEPQYRWLNAKVKLNVETPSRSLSGKGTLKVRKDSLMWLTVSPALGIEVMRAQISQDSVQVLDRVNNRYRHFGFQRVDQLLTPAQRDFTFQNLSNMLTGQPVFMPNSDYQLVSADSGGIAMTYEDKVFKEELNLLPSRLKTQQFKLRKPATQQSMTVTYSNYQQVDRYQIPGMIKVEAQRPEPVTLIVELRNVSFEEEDRVSFSVPDSYE
jgi:hypothetical protein